MAIKTVHDTFDKTWFITFTCFNWIPLFEITNSYDLVYDFLNLIKLKDQAETLGFVIMPNHAHFILHLNSDKINLSTMIGNGKRFMAYELVDRLQESKQYDLLNRLSEGCSEKEKSKGQLHKAFEPSFDAKPIYTMEFFCQKLNYIHYNPVRGKWNLSTDFPQYKHSSAAFYELGIKHSSINIFDYRNLWG